MNNLITCWRTFSIIPLVFLLPRRSATVLLACFIFLLLCAAEADVLPGLGEYSKTNPDAVHPSIWIYGEIKRGDFDEFERLVKHSAGFTQVVQLYSPGGDVLEAMRIGHLVRKLRLEVWAPTLIDGVVVENWGVDPKDYRVAPENSVCASACFFIYVAGVRRKGAVLGIHRPFLADDAYKQMDIDEAIEFGVGSRNVISEYLYGMGVTAEFIEKMYAISSDNMYWLEPLEIKQQFAGFIPEIDEWLGANCEKLTVAEASILYDNEVAPWDDGVEGYTLYAEAYTKKARVDACKGAILRKSICEAWINEYGEPRHDCVKYFSR